LRRSLGKRILAHAAGAFSRGFFGFTTRHVRHDCRWHLHGPLDEVLRGDGQLILAAWHQDVLPLFHYLVTYTKLEKKRPFSMLASRSFDGEVTERILTYWGLRFVRGSAGKAGGHAALRGLRRALEAGDSVVIIADGPQPPPYVMRSGPVFLARETGVPLYVARTWARPQFLVAGTWFRMAIPLPRAHYALFSAGPVDAGGEFEEARLRAEEALNHMCELADAHLYLRKSVRGGIRLGARDV
jgi:lysophospholipid acyltransferase (LPLAT)-like uncharacterized protein